MGILDEMEKLDEEGELRSRLKRIETLEEENNQLLKKILKKVTKDKKKKKKGDKGK